MDRLCMYLRKSRADEELEKTLGEGETLSKHRKALLKLAKERNYNIVEIKEEIVSGESLFFRPKMLELLKEVEEKKYDGVLVMDMQRLGRGDMQDQGIILNTFKQSSTKIITPNKVYDLNNDFDEEYSEFEAFMSRKELKMITKRMQGGRVRSIEDGNYIATNPPLGYEIQWAKRSRTLAINPEEAEIVKMIFKLYSEGSGAGSIANTLNSFGYKTKFKNNFSSSSVLAILKNPIYIGKVTWKKKEIKKSKNPDKVKDTRTRDKSEWIIADGKHEAIIEMETWNKVQQIVKGKYHIPYQIANGPANPIAGLVICAVCGSKMVMRKYGTSPSHLICLKKCGNKSARFEYVENTIMDALEDYLKNYKAEVKKEEKNNIKVYELQLVNLKKEVENCTNQKLKLFDLLEQGVYDNATFLERSNILCDRITKIMSGIERLDNLIEQEKRVDKAKYSQRLRKVVFAYKASKNVQYKNELLKSVLIKAEYKKEKHQKDDDFEVKLFPKLMR